MTHLGGTHSSWPRQTCPHSHGPHHTPTQPWCSARLHSDALLWDCNLEKRIYHEDGEKMYRKPLDLCCSVLVEDTHSHSAPSLMFLGQIDLTKFKCYLPSGSGSTATSLRAKSHLFPRTGALILNVLFPLFKEKNKSMTFTLSQVNRVNLWASRCRWLNDASDPSLLCS